MDIAILLTGTMRIFRKFAKTYGVGARSKHRNKNWYRDNSHENIILNRDVHTYGLVSTCTRYFVRESLTMLTVHFEM